jgi:hypothetical protein
MWQFASECCYKHAGNHPNSSESDEGERGISWNSAREYFFDQETDRNSATAHAGNVQHARSILSLPIVNYTGSNVSWLGTDFLVSNLLVSSEIAKMLA